MALRWLIALLIGWTSVAHAVEFRLPVEDTSEFSIEVALQQAVVRAAEQMTGIPSDELTADAPDLFSLSEAFVNSYGFEDEAFLVDIDVEGLKDRLRSSGISIWDGPRPSFLMWMTEERGLERVMVGAEPHPVIDQVLEAGARFNINISRPLMDLEDTLALSPAEIWGEFAGAVETASARYGSNHMIVLGDRPARQTLRYWLYSSDGDTVSGEVTGQTPSERTEAFIGRLMAYARAISDKQTETERDAFADRPTLRNQMPLQGEALRLRIRFSDVIDLMALLDHLSTHTADVQVATFAISGSQADVQVTTGLSLQAIDEVVSSFEGIQFVSPLVYALN